ncbi:transmembrane protein 14C [Choanephora cucurbitarum]|uniref:Transmembrane protein 14C n=1 Tax=Choanephora cucurbitarum TaxID=101091 RepID=A0A1C7NN54_9FUNG|nr:transmembrane protein 14C [Choanephora cucurbitarum]OBZ90553.1 Transmembrane protein 14C [Choanephora cucurbitarum]
MTDTLGYAYGATVMAGGIVGYVKAGSTASLVAGVVSGGLAILGANQVSRDPRNVLLSFVVSLILLFVMGSRFYRGRKFMPAGLVSLLSLLMVIRYGTRLYSQMQ